MAPPAGQKMRPGRYFAFFVVIVAALYSLVFFTGDGNAAPKLGIDLKGGTRVTLTARTPDGSEPSREQLQQARQIIENRVNGIGVSGAEVVLDGTNVVITVPGEQGEQAKTLGQTARLDFRQAIAAVPAGGAQQQPPPGTGEAGGQESESGDGQGGEAEKGQGADGDAGQPGDSPGEEPAQQGTTQGGGGSPRGTVAAQQQDGAQGENNDGQDGDEGDSDGNGDTLQEEAAAQIQ